MGVLLLVTSGCGIYLPFSSDSEGEKQAKRDAQATCLVQLMNATTQTEQNRALVLCILTGAIEVPELSSNE